MMNEQTKKLGEALAGLEHEQWVVWSKNLVASEGRANISGDRLQRWGLLWKPYPELTEEQKDQDRKWAHLILQACKEAGLKFVPDELNIGEAINSYRDTSFALSVAFDQGKFASRDAIKSQIKEIDIE